MENTNKQIESILKISIPKQAKFMLKKKPIAKFITAALLVLGCSSASADFFYSRVDNDEESIKSGQQIKDAIVEEGQILEAKGTSNAQNTQVNAGGYFKLNNNSSANATHVWGGAFILLDDEGTKADNSKIHSGRMELLGDSIASNTFVGLTDEEDSFNKILDTLGVLSEEKNSEKSAKMEMYDDAEANNTKVGINGELILRGSNTVNHTTVNKAGRLTVNSESILSPLLNNTSVMGALALETEVTLEGKTEFLPGAQLHTYGEDITNNGELTFTNMGGGMFAVIEGRGSLTINSPGKTFTLVGTGKSKDDEYFYSGLTHIKAGRLVLLDTRFSTSPIIGEKYTRLILSNSVLTTGVQGSDMLVDEGSVWNMTRNSDIGELTVLGNSHINLSGYSLGAHEIGNKLHINGDYQSDDGANLTFYSKLAGDASETDSMLVEGDTSGLTHVKVINLGGEGAQTDLGIQLIEVKGQSDGDFKQVSRITAGAYEYKLSRGKADLNKNWYLTSNIESYDKKSTPEEQLGVIPGKGDDKAVKPNGSPHEVIDIRGKGYPPHPINQLLAALAPEKEDGKADVVAAPAKAEAENISAAKPTDTQPTDVVAMTPVKTKADNSKDIPQKTYKPVYRPESGSYIANLSMARNLFTSGLENRSGNYQYQDAITGEWRTTSMWIHTQGGRKQFGNTVDQLNIKGKYHSIQLGGDLAQWSIGAQGSWRIGMLAGFGKATNYSQSKITGYYSNGSVNGYNLGIYATWLTDQQDKTGFYIDTLAQYGWFNNTVNGQEQAEEKYKSSGFTSSVEGGYTFNIGSTDQLSYFIQPNAQITWVGINAQTHTTANKDVINYNNRGQLVTRIGAKTYLQTTNNMNQQFMPFIAVNWLHQNKNTGTQLSGQRVENKSKNSAEFKIGVESKIDQKLHVWANINHQMGSYDNNDTNALVGLKYHF